ncbi:MAG: DUF4838 domain-containing protein [Clostridia bacterium]|nr:DUF4838 domain-containing protein [Clostridia bacterium]
MNVIFARIGRDKTCAFAFSELKRILKQMDPTLVVDGRIYDEVDPEKKNVIWLGLDGSVEKTENDSIRIQVENGAGVITGSCNRAVLLAAYRFLKELGCRFLRPGKDGEIIPKKKLCRENLTVKVTETASYRHRGVCIEGCNAYEHVYNMIDFLPKVGMNGYFMQFHTPSTFFKRYYNINPNPHVEVDELTDDDIGHMWQSLEEEIALRALDYHATGHGWTCAPFGIPASGWDRRDDWEMPPEALKVMAELNGHRGLYKRVALNTNLCYSNPEVREKMNDSIVAYCKEHPDVNFLHFWLADGTNNHCECEECRKMTPADYYVKTLNELDVKLTAAGVPTKIVCLIYVDLLWAPQVEKIANPDRFVLMFAPITRTYTNAFVEADLEEKVELVPYKRNENVMPRSVAENVARLKIWQREQLSGDSFDFDYHLMWDHHLDPGYYECARVLHKDMANLDKIGLGGMMSCQGQRVFFPTGLPFYAMAAGLWDKTSRFEDVTKEYFTAAFGDEAETVETYLSTLSRLFDPVYLRREKPIDDAFFAGLDKAKRVIAAFEKDVLATAPDTPAWEHLRIHAVMATAHADMLAETLKADSTEESRLAAKEKLQSLFYSFEERIGDAFDPVLYNRIFNRTLNKFFDAPKVMLN